MQQITNGNLLEIIDLANSLRQEHLFIANEQNAFNNLNDTLKRNSSNVAQLAWICAQQKRNLNRLISSRPESGPSFCCRKSSVLENTRFVDAYKANGMKYQHVLAYNELFNFLHRSPYLLAQSLSIGDSIKQITSNQMLSVIHTISTGLYGNAILSKDVDMVLRLLRDLIEIQIIVSDNPRRMLRNGSSAFSRLFQRLHETMFSSKVFLTAALYEPIMKVLTADEAILNVDTAKAVQNLSQKDRLKRFGVEGTTEYEEKVRQFHKETVTSLYTIAMLFIQSLLDHWSLFPSTLRWVLQTMGHLLKSVHVHENVINDILVDMVFTNFICIAIVSPDLIGISDASISENARYNLIQIGQIMQMLALNKHETIDQKFEDIFAYFQANIVSDLMEQLLESEYDISVTTIAIPQQNDFGRDHVLVTQNELNVFVDFLRTVLDHDQLSISGDDRRKLSKILEQLPDKFEAILNGDRQNIPLAPEHQSKTKQLINLGKSTKNKLAKSMSLNVASSELDDQTTNYNLQSVFNANGHGTANSSPIHSSHLGNSATAVNNNNNTSNFDEQVLMIPITICDDSKFKILTEQEVLNMNNITISNGMEEPLAPENIDEMDKGNDDDFDVMAAGLPSRKHTRFSLSQDDQSIGNTSDNLEVVSEAPSNHSVTSSLEMEENDQNLNDNLSDMVSANVSGRGTPNISGRDTPSSQVTEGDNVQVPTPQMTKISNKARSDIDDKFCKFEIKKLVEGDETVSIISDTWSTDVLASDSETLEPTDNERNFSTPLIPSAVVLPGDNNFNPIGAGQLNANFLDASDARSESAWSTDVLASDSEKMAEVDTDDNQSIAAKSDTTDAGRPEIDPIPDLIPSVSQRGGNEIQHSALQSPNLNYRTPESPIFKPRTSELRLDKNRRFEDNFGNANEGSSGFPSEDLIKLNASPVGSARNSSRFSDVSLFRNNRSFAGGSSFERDPFLPAPASSSVRRQNSAESSISNQSSSLDEPPPLRLNHRFNRSNGSKAFFPQTDFSRGQGSQKEGSGTVLKTNTEIKNPFNDEVTTLPNTDDFEGEEVKHRPSSAEQRNVSFDGRRNGMMVNASSSTMTKRLASSLTYENHEIIISKTSSLQLISPLECTATDDDKHQHRDEYALLLKTLSMSLKDDTTAEEAPIGTEPALVTSLVTPKSPMKYTGTIPKSISFDTSAGKNRERVYLRQEDATFNNYQSYSNGQRQHSSGFFNKIKQGFKNRRSNKIVRGGQEEFPAPEAPIRIRSGTGDGQNAFNKPPLQVFSDTTDDILAKYRRKISSSSEATNSADSLGNSSGERKLSLNAEEQRLSLMTIDKKIHLYGVAKHKLRLVLSTTDLHTADFRHTNSQNAAPILTYLHIQLAQAFYLQNLQQIAFISETIRCMKLLDSNQVKNLLTDLQSDLVKRQSYLQYLMCYRQRLLSALESIDRLKDRLRNEREMCNHHLIMVCVRMFLEKREEVVQQFQDEFSVLTVVDEKLDCMNEFMARLMDELRTDAVFYGMVDWQLDEARNCIESILMQRLYRQVMFPNTDADIDRDQVLHEHIRKLARLITPSHNALRIPEEYLSEAPWPFAQQQISFISAYKTAREKVICVVRCVTSIMNLLSMSSNRVASADDLIPVLIYVIIKANPPYLLSTMQYVNAFYGDLITGEDHYWWTQFCSAVTFIKTMDYSD